MVHHVNRVLQCSCMLHSVDTMYHTIVRGLAIVRLAILHQTVPNLEAKAQISIARKQMDVSPLE
jgi:hypothetical protein